MTAVVTSAIRRLGLNRDEVVLLVAQYAELVAAARASVAAEDRGEPNPLVHVRHALAGHGQLPPDGMAPLTLLAHPEVPVLAACLCADGCPGCEWTGR
ncbi:hypothetical protein [Nonomuraea typhae]|uniref:hypothetical protein n=1 Tax=Nonomuraea typhae TaxID=2603600 RepID=UPI0015E1C3B2|nr:hypothetical protein [Nonomuraea typhae]